MSLDLGFGHAGNHPQDVEIFRDEEDPVDFGPAQMAHDPVACGGYAFEEEYYVVDNGTPEGPVVLPVHEVEMENFIVGACYNFPGSNLSPLF